ncbi:MAG: hypothetical protein ACK4ZJ_18295, partial [Allorhizobium sp.]
MDVTALLAPWAQRAGASASEGLHAAAAAAAAAAPVRAPAPATATATAVDAADSVRPSPSRTGQRGGSSSSSSSSSSNGHSGPAGAQRATRQRFGFDVSDFVQVSSAAARLEAGGAPQPQRSTVGVSWLTPSTRARLLTVFRKHCTAAEEAQARAREEEPA